MCFKKDNSSLGPYFNSQLAKRKHIRHHKKKQQYPSRKAFVLRHVRDIAHPQRTMQILVLAKNEFGTTSAQRNPRFYHVVLVWNYPGAHPGAMKILFLARESQPRPLFCEDYILGGGPQTAVLLTPELGWWNWSKIVYPRCLESLGGATTYQDLPFKREQNGRTIFFYRSMLCFISPQILVLSGSRPEWSNTSMFFLVERWLLCIRCRLQNYNMVRTTQLVCYIVQLSYVLYW